MVSDKVHKIPIVVQVKVEFEADERPLLSEPDEGTLIKYVEVNEGEKVQLNDKVNVWKTLVHTKVDNNKKKLVK